MPYRPKITAATASATDSSALDFPEDLNAYKVASLPIIANFLQKLGVTSHVDKHVASPQNISSGQIVSAMVMDTLAGRSPLYKLHEFFIGQDTELIFGSSLAASDFNDNNVGKVLDNIHTYGASKLFSQISWEACQRYDLDDGFAHYDTTSVSVYGDYEGFGDPGANRIAITYGHSKDKRPDMKQFMMDALCVKGNIPLLGAVLSGNTSDKKANNAELTQVASHIKKYGLDPMAYVYVADSALICKDNLEALTQQHFISRLPANYKVEQAAINTAYEANTWTELGSLALDVDPSSKRPSARYKLHETTVDLYGVSYRAIVVHSSAHDKRRTKKLDKQIAAEKEAFLKLAKKTSKETLNCPSDAQNRLEAILKAHPLHHHELEATITQTHIYARGRPKAGQERRIAKTRYQITLTLKEQTEAIARIRERSGCFVLISNVPSEGPERHHNASEILQAYKDQNGIEMNFRFLKDKQFVNNTFLKNPERIEALGFILLLLSLIHI